jgi:hypothetical protein
MPRGRAQTLEPSASRRTSRAAVVSGETTTARHVDERRDDYGALAGETTGFVTLSESYGRRALFEVFAVGKK